MKNFYRQCKSQILSQHNETNDILRDIYGSQCEIDYNSSQKVSENVSEPIDRLIWPAGPPFGLGISTGSTYTSFGLLEMGNMYNYGNLRAPEAKSKNKKSYNKFKDSLCYKILQNDVLKIVKSSNLFDLTDATNVINLKLISKMHSSIYLRHYSATLNSDDNIWVLTQLLDRPIDELFKEIIESQEQGTDNKKRKVEEIDLDHHGGQLWVDKYKPLYFSDLLSDEKVNREALCWLNSWKKLEERGDLPRILILGGPPGVGKSTLVHVIARHCNFKVVEINASDDRTKDRLMPMILSITTTNSATGQPNLCLLEEIDGFASGEEQVVLALVSLLEKRNKNGSYKVKRPIICTCNDLYNKNLRKLRQIAKILIVNPPDELSLMQRLQNILSSESITMDPLMLSSLINLYREDIRSCISALDYYTREYRKNKTFSIHLQNILDAFKDQSSRIDEFVRLVFSLSKDDDSMKDISNKIVSILSTGQVNPNFNTMAGLLDDHLLRLPYNSPNMVNISYIMDLLAQSDVINNKIIAHPRCSSLIVPYLATLNKIRPLQSSRFSNIIYPALSIHNIGLQRRLNSLNIIKTLQSNAIPQLASHIKNPSFITDTLSFILCMLRPREILLEQNWSDMGKFFKNVNIVQELLQSTKSSAEVKQLMQIIRIMNIYGIHITRMQTSENISGEYHFDPDVTLLQMESWNIHNFNNQKMAYFNNSAEKFDFKPWKIDSSVCELLDKAINWINNAWLHHIVCISKMGVNISSAIKSAIIDSYINGPQFMPTTSILSRPSISTQVSISTKQDELVDSIVHPTFKEVLDEHIDMINRLRLLRFNNTSGKYKYVLENNTTVYHIVTNFQDLFK